ncbi:MAG: hypothetical protein KTV68_15310 [Acidimicrobiia bacterium]|nr:hypothetical protein [Acidimicrobiia bacterium]MCY4433724.1 hypothetical protein [bacterium]
MEDYFQQLVRSWRSVTSRTVREAVAVLLLLIVVFGSGFSALTTYADVVVFNEDRFAEELDGIFLDEDVHNVVSTSFVATTVEMADLPVIPAGSAGAQQVIQQEVPAVVGQLLADEANARLLERIIRQAHSDVLAVMGGTLVANPPVRSVEVDLEPIFNQMLAEIAANEELAFLDSVNPPADAGVVTVLQRAEPGDRFWEFLGQLQDRRSSTITLILLCGIGSLLISPSRTRVVWSIGTGIVAMAGILGVGIYGTRALLAVLIDNTDTVRAAQAIHDALLGDLGGRLMDMALIGVLMIVIGAVLGWIWRRFGPTPPEEKALAVPDANPTI